ncbi:MAG: cyclopropane-fatty-acyl-phospholipid synthase, partial [Hyphomicrobiales bacterium]|nr:cyclopropane-fatty-acyl-phospholipid synthase [Hyphomicrobiales bacterium]
AQETLEEAQAAKLARISDLLDKAPGQSVLEIGCAWGALARTLARDAGALVTGLTLSPAQLAFAQERNAREGLAERIDLRLEDYRDVGGVYDRIVSIEMIEAVGERYWPNYFGAVRDRLKPGGSALLQVITIADDRYADYSRTPDFIQRYVFPGGMLPSKSGMRASVEAAGLEIVSSETFGLSYAVTLAEWRHRFHLAWPAIADLGFDQRFRKLWEYYLCYCEAGFRAGTIDVGLYKLAHAGR